MAFEIKAAVRNDPKLKTKAINIAITQDGKPFYEVTHSWSGLKPENEDRFNSIVGPLLGTVGIEKDGKGIIGPIPEDEMISFQVGLTGASKKLNAWAIEDAESKGRDVESAKAALEKT